MKNENQSKVIEPISNEEMQSISGGTGQTRVIIVIDGVPTIIWV